MKTTKRKRLATYRKALKHLEEGIPKFGMENFGLCLILPCIYYNLGDFNDPINGRAWDYRETQEAFPELQDIIAQLLEYERKYQYSDVSYKEYHEKKNALRIKLLKEYLHVNN